MRDSSNEANKRAYELIARRYAGDAPAEDDPVMRMECRRIFTEALRGSQIVEIGCGPGVDANFLSQEGLNVTATDFCSEFIAIVQERFPDLTTHKMDMTKPDLPDGSFDGLYAFASFIHLPRDKSREVLLGFRKMLKRPGVLFMSLIQSSKLSEYTIEDWGGQSNNPLLFTCYPQSEIKKLLREAGFQKVEFFAVPSKLYEELPRLVERGVTHYQVLAHT